VIKIAISETIQALRNELKMTQPEFADLIYVSVSLVNRWEYYKVLPNRMACDFIIEFVKRTM